jgi:hypothetical protein
MVITSLKTKIKYIVKWEYEGFSYAIPVVYKNIQKKFLFLKRNTFKKVWEGNSKHAIEAEKMLPPEMIEWFKEAVNQYEEYTIAWSKAKIYEILSNIYPDSGVNFSNLSDIKNGRTTASSGMTSLIKLVTPEVEAILMDILNDKSKTKAILNINSDNEAIAKFSQYIIKN